MCLAECVSRCGSESDGCFMPRSAHHLLGFSDTEDELNIETHTCRTKFGMAAFIL